MNFTITTVARSLADYLAPVLPGVTFYEDPNQQGTSCPCAFLQQRGSQIQLGRAGWWLRTIDLDLTYLEDYNLPDLQQRYLQAAQALDLVMETVPYQDGETQETALLRTYDRDWRIDLDALHYRFQLRVWVRQPEEPIYMQEIETLNQEVHSAQENGISQGSAGW